MGVLSWLGQKFQKPTAKELERELYQRSYLDDFHNNMAPGMTVKKLARVLNNASDGDLTEYQDLIDDIQDRDLRITGIMETRENAVSGLEYDIHAATEDKKDEEIADFVRTALEYVDNLPGSMEELATAMGRGFSALEPVWEMTDGSWLISRFEPIPQRRFVIPQKTESLRLWTPEEPVNGVELPWGKCMIHACAKGGSLRRAGLWRPLTWYWLYMNLDWKSWIGFLELYGSPLRVGRYEPGTNPKDIEVLQQAVLNAVRDQGVVISKNTEIEFVQAMKSGSTDAHERFHDSVYEDVAIRVLGQSLTTSTSKSGGGAMALGNVHGSVKQEVKVKDARNLAGTINSQAIVWLVNLKYGPQKKYPWLSFRCEAEKDQLAQSERDLNNVNAGAKIPQRYFQEEYGYPEPQADDEIAVPPSVRAAQNAAGPVAGLSDFQHHLPEAGFSRGPVLPGIGVRADRNGGPKPPMRSRALALSDSRMEAAYDLPFTVDDVAGQAGELALSWFEYRAQKFIEWHGTENADAEEGGLDGLWERLEQALLASWLIGVHQVEKELKQNAPLALGLADDDWTRVDPQRAVDYLKALVPLTESEMGAATQRMRDAAFTIAKSEDARFVKNVQDALAEALAEGTTERDFKKTVNEAADRLGVSRLKPFHLETVFRTNSATALSAGRFEQQRKPHVMAALPWSTFHAVDDGRTSEVCLAYQGFTARTDDPIWSSITPPLHYNCRSWVSVSAEGTASPVPITTIPAGFDRSPSAVLDMMAAGEMPKGESL